MKLRNSQHYKTSRRVAIWKGSLVAVIGGVVLAGTSVLADVGNQLTNPGWENGAAGWTTLGSTPINNTSETFYPGGVCFPNGNDLNPPNFTAVDGTNSAQIYGGTGNDSYWQQIVPTVSGATWSASTYAYIATDDHMTNCSFYVDVAFLDINNSVLTEYQSGSLTNTPCSDPSVDTWLYLAVTNQVQNGSVIGTLPSGVFSAPVGTVAVRYRELYHQYAGGSGSIFLDLADLDLVSGPVLVAPVIANLTPQYIYFCTNSALTFNALGGNGATITNVQVVATITGLPGAGAGTNVVTYSPGSPGLTLIGLGTTNVGVSLALNTNALYSVTVQITDNNNTTIQISDQFDTVQPVLEWEAEDFNFSGGEWVTNVASNGGVYAYTNAANSLTAVDDTFANYLSHPGGAYRPNETKVNTQVLGEQTRSGVAYTQQKYANDVLVNPGDASNPQTEPACVGWLTVNDWLNYTRTFPPGTYNVYARIASGGGGSQCVLEQVLGDPTQSGQTVTNLGTFSNVGYNWNIDEYCPLQDAFGNLVDVTLGGTETLKVQITGNPNLDSFLIVPAVTIKTPVLVSSYPDGNHPFEPTNYLTFTVGPGGGSSISAGNVHLSLNGADVTAQVVFNSTPTNWTGTIPILSNATYSVVINVTNSTHLFSTFSSTIDTFSQDNYMFEAEDFDFNGGYFIDDPVPSGDFTYSGNYTTGTLLTNSYWFYPAANENNAAIAGIDFSNSVSGPPVAYRPLDSFGTQVAGDYLRAKFTNSAAILNDPNIGDFNIGYFNPGMWANYTRNYPQGNYLVYARAACGNGAYTNAPLSLVTSGWGTVNQTTTLLGTFTDTNPPANWQVYEWVPLQDQNGNLVNVQFNGSTNTLRLGCATNGSINVNFLMLVPTVAPFLPVSLVITHTGSQVNISFATQANHTYTVLYASSLNSPVAWSTLATISGNGGIQTASDSIGATSRFYRVSAQ